MRYVYTVAASLLLGLWLAPVARATHLRAGEIVAVRDPQNPFRYCFLLTTYTDNVGGSQANMAQADVTFFFGDGTSAVAPRENGPAGTPIGNETSVNRYYVCHVFPGNGLFTVSVGIQNRNSDVVNLGPGSSSEIEFFVRTTILVNAQLGFNSTPVLQNPPLDQACVGQRFVHNPAAFDTDGDSIAYRITTPSRFSGNQGVGSFIGGYQEPTAVNPASLNEARNAPATFSINALNGDLVWDAPGGPRIGEYNVAFVVEEWRNGSKISETVRDMQIVVKDCANRRPQLVLPNDTCVEAGYRFTNVLIRATDPDGHPITLTSDTTSSGVYGPDFPAPLATFLPDRPQPQPSPASGRFNWQTACEHVRQQPYDVLFKAEDNPPPPGANNRLADLKTWRITVVAPRPRNLRAAPNPATKSVTLRWDSYLCQRPGAEILIWRKAGCGYVPGPCERGLPASSGYQVVGRVPASATTFTDTNGGKGLDRGVVYSYRISVQYVLPAGGASLASEEACVDLPLQVPVITNVTVDKTNRGNASDGEITVKWTRPSALDQSVYLGPYAYRLYRADGLTGTNYTALTGNLPADLSGGQADTVYTDRGLNTRDASYRYRLEFYFTSGSRLTLLDTTTSASSVRLDSLPAINAIDLSWQAIVPWSNDNQTHRVYRESRTQPGVFNLIAEVPVQGPPTYRYRDDGVDRFVADGNQSVSLSADSLYCYKVETVGSYGNVRIPSPLRNFSQEICATPRDTVRPCPPQLSIDTLICRAYGNNDETPEVCAGPYTNQLRWTYPEQNAQGIRCKEPVKYNLYYTRYEGETFALVATITGAPPAKLFDHQGLTSYAGCYYVTAVDRSGNESQPSNTVCKDNCPYYELPNVFTPNGDTRNETFRPYECPQFVESVNVIIYNRWGKKVFESDRNVFIDWNGRLGTNEDTQGKELSTGVYYYLAKVKFQRLRRQDEVQTLKGWVNILR
ncbi:MAG: gliding motility-associated C-terminal domain-containing protein [Ferruginibacter sp.]|nr:gliding motility-associated C-terminal domain-containing protein [Cytophagales bacterium]